MRSSRGRSGAPVLFLLQSKRSCDFSNENDQRPGTGLLSLALDAALEEKTDLLHDHTLAPLAQRLAELLARERAAADSPREAWVTIARVLLNLDEFITRE